MDSELNDIILNHQVTAILIMNESLLVKYANPAAEQLFSQSAKRIVDHPLSHLIQHASMDLALLSQPLQSGQSITDSDVTFVVDGKPLMLEVTVSPISWKKELMLLVEMRKIGQQRRLSQELNQHAQQQAAKLRGRGGEKERKKKRGGERGEEEGGERKGKEESLAEYTQIHQQQANTPRALVARPQ